LVAEFRVQSFALPAAYGLDPQSRVTTGTVLNLFGHIFGNHLRIILGRDGAQQLADIVVPRLLSPTIIRRIRTASASAAAMASENFCIQVPPEIALRFYHRS